MSTDITDGIVETEIEGTGGADDSAEDTGPTTGAASAASPQSRWSPTNLALTVGLTVVTLLGGLAGWLGFEVHQSQLAADQRAEFVQGARQGAVNLTTIDWQHADADVKRIMDSATGTFYDDFAKRSGPFVDVVKQAQSKSEGTITLAGLESVTGNQARVLVAVSVTTVTAGAPQPSPRAWRMRMDVQKVGNAMKIANVEFVP